MSNLFLFIFCQLVTDPIFSHNTPMNDNRQQAAEKKVLLSAANLSVDLQGKSIIRDVNLQLTHHDFITVIGPNGAGKSSLLKVLLGILPKFKGHIYRNPDMCIGYVPQQFHVPRMMPMTVQNFLTLDMPQSINKIDAILSKLEMLEYKSTFMYQLSGGQRQRVLIARALLKEPDILVLDEPAQNLDIKSQVSLYQFLSALYKEHQISILMVSHDLHMVMALTTHVICLNGHVCCAGEPELVAKDPAFVSIFGDELASMVSFYQHTHEDKGGCHE